jgi:hypothetical protein
MAHIMSDVEDALVQFVRERIPVNEWKRMTTSGHILGALDEESENELKDHFWNQLIASVRWYTVLDDIERMADKVIESESDSEPMNEEF